MGTSSKIPSRKPARSVTLPCRSHPNIDRMEKLLNIVKTWESSSSPSAEMICSGLSHLTVLYEFLEDLLNPNLSQNPRAFSNHTMKWTDELLDMSVKFLDICCNTTDVMSQTKQQVRDFGCDLRRNGGCSTESTISKYIGFRHKLKKDIKGSMASLKQVDSMIRGFPLMVDSENYHQMCLIRLIREVTSFSIVIFRSLIEFLATPRVRRRRWTSVSRFLSNSKVVPEDGADALSVNELRRLDATLLKYYSSEKQELLQPVRKDLEALEATLEGIDSHLHLLSRRLIATRASILNMVSFY